MFWEQITNWIKSKGGFAHLVAVVYLTAVAAYAAVPAFASLLNHVYSAMPSWLHEIVLAAVGVIAWYKNTEGKNA